MTVATQGNFVTYIGDAVAVTFAFGFPVYDADHLEVFVKTTSTGAVVTTYNPGDYTVAGIGDESGGSITVPAAPTALQTIVISRQVPLTQDLDVQNQGGFYPDNVENEFDLQEMQTQQLAEWLSRTIYVPLGETFDGDVGIKSERLETVIGFDDAGALMLYSVDELGTEGPPGPPISEDTLFDMLDGMLVQSTGITMVFDTITNTITFSAPGAGLTAEDVRDVIGTALTSTDSSVTITVDDPGDTINLAASAEFIRDTIGTAVTEGFGIDITVSDPSNTITFARANPAIQSVASSATVTPTFTNDQVNITAQAANLTLANPTGTAVDGFGIVIRIKDNGTARTIGYGTQYRAIGVTLPTTTVVNKTLYLGMIFNDAATKWDVVAVRQEA